MRNLAKRRALTALTAGVCTNSGIINICVSVSGTFATDMLFTYSRLSFTLSMHICMSGGRVALFVRVLFPTIRRLAAGFEKSGRVFVRLRDKEKVKLTTDYKDHRLKRV